MLTNAERRRKVLSQHANLREMIGEMLETAGRIAGGEEAERITLRAQLAMLHSALELHLLDEEQLLEPVLARADGSGAEFLARMNQEHAEQRALLAALHSGLGGTVSARGLAANAVAVGRRLLQDMEAEEGELLSAEALGDAPRSSG